MNQRWIDDAELRHHLGSLPPEDIPALGMRALGEGFDGPALRELAWLEGGDRRATWGDIEDLFERAMLEMGRTPFPEPGVRTARRVAARIISGELEPYEGARLIWYRVSEEHGRPDELTVFVSLASQYEDDPERRPLYAAEIVEAARKLASE